MIAARFAQRVQETGIVGASLLFVKDGTAMHQAVAGLQDRTTNRPVDRPRCYLPAVQAGPPSDDQYPGPPVVGGAGGPIPTERSK